METTNNIDNSSTQQQKTVKQKRSSVGKWLLRIILIIFGVVILLVSSVYVPFVQRFVLKNVLEQINEGGDINISVDDFSLSFPLDVQANDVLVKQNADTLLYVNKLDADIALLPILNGRVELTNGLLHDIRYQQGNQDSLLYIDAEILDVNIDRVVANLKSNEVEISSFLINEADIDLSLKSDTIVKNEVDTNAVALPWIIKADEICVKNVGVNMSMDSSIKSISAQLNSATAKSTDFNLSNNTLLIDSFVIDAVGANLFTNPEYVDLTQEESSSTQWNIAINKIVLNDGNALYAVDNYTPVEGFDPNYIEANNINIDVEKFRFDSLELSVPIKRFYANERCGLQLNVSGLFEMDSIRLSAKDFKLATLASQFDINANLGLGTPLDNQPLDLNIASEISIADLQILFPQYHDILADMPRNRKIEINSSLNGSIGDIQLDNLSVELPNHWSVAAKGHIAEVLDIDKAIGSIDITGNIINAKRLSVRSSEDKSKVLLQIPKLDLNGNISFNNGLVNGNIISNTQEGNLALKAKFDKNKTDYNLYLQTANFPIDAFMPGIGVEDLTATVDANGKGFDFTDSLTSLIAEVNIPNVIYNGLSLENIEVSAKLHNGLSDVALKSNNKYIDADIFSGGNIYGDEYTWSIVSDISHIDFKSLNIIDTISSGAVKFTADARYAPLNKSIDADLNVDNIDILYGSKRIAGKQLNLKFDANESATNASIVNQDLKLRLSSPVSLDTILAYVDSTTAVLNDITSNFDADIRRLQSNLPAFYIDLNVGNNNIISDYFKSDDIAFNEVSLQAKNDSLISIEANVDKLIAGETRVDDINLSVIQNTDTINYTILVDNEPGTMDDFAKVRASGYIRDNKFTINLNQQNISGSTGYNFGTDITLSDSIIVLNFTPSNPTIAYKQWTINADNYLQYDQRDRTMLGDISMQGDGSLLRLFTDIDSISNSKRVFVDIDNIKIQDWIALSPYAPPMKGILSADVSVGKGINSLNGNGVVSLTDFVYNKRRVGTLDLDLDLSTARSGAVLAKLSLDVDKEKVITAEGALNDSTAASPVMLDFNVDRFPLKAVNPFISTLGSLDGYLSGKMDVTGDIKSPHFNGFVQFDSALVHVDKIGTTFSFNDGKIPVDSNVINFDNYEIYAANQNPLNVNGKIDVRNPLEIDVDLAMNADNIQLIGNNRRRGSDVYGKAFVSLDATAKGDLRFINVDANVSIKPQTNVTYIIPDGTSALASRSTFDMVTFMNFADTTQVVQVDSLAPPPTAVMVNAALDIEDGATIGVDLSIDGTNRVQIQPTGNLDYSMSPMGDSRFTGRINLNKGYARYTPPLMSEKEFDIQNSSYVTFNGDMMSPNLNIYAIDQITANVNQDGQNSRLINFDVSLAVTGTLDRMDIKFDLSTNEDVTIQNEIQSMSPEQRASQAMNLLLYNTYTGPNTHTDNNLGNNALYSFVESTVNSWMAQNIKAVDIQFGIDQYQRTLDGTSSMATNYSYKVSKSFLDDRIKIVVGGNYSTDADADENVSDNLFNDVSVEYYINENGSMYVKIFRKTGFESIVEGEVTQTGAGFVFKRKLRTIGDLFRSKSAIERRMKLEQDSINNK